MQVWSKSLTVDGCPSQPNNPPFSSKILGLWLAFDTLECGPGTKFMLYIGIQKSLTMTV